MDTKNIIVILLASVSSSAFSIDRSNVPDNNMGLETELSNEEISYDSPLSEGGTGPFSAIREAIGVLVNDKNTDWAKVNLDGFRIHLIQMEDITLNVSVVMFDIDGGFGVVVTPTTERARLSLDEVLGTYPQQIYKETGWMMEASQVGGSFKIMVRTNNFDELPLLRGLGYIGVMAWGESHLPHHYGIVSGSVPFSGEHTH